ncbi:MAG: hypothetical protein CM1200mP10_18580 [Candidatus Neomarinimicrobiota bacterium]|nr:MAG: hypothetical protein CM1200mP10_18580 [Candidatus Neomarinimicrobiota bacterium]
MEVKSATYVENGIAEFPDAVTDRGKRHVQSLQALVETGFQAGVLFVVQRSDADSFPNPCGSVIRNSEKHWLMPIKRGYMYGVLLHVFLKRI